MAFSQAELDNITAQSIDLHMRGTIHSQHIQDRPLLAILKGKSKAFPGGKDLITTRVKGVNTTTLLGFTHDDTVNYANPANVKVASSGWKEVHAGIQVSMTELKKNGINVVDSNDLSATSMAEGREKIALSNLLEDKYDDMSEGYAEDFDQMLHEDGTQDAKEVAGIKSIIVDDPTDAGTIQGIDQVANTWWTNREKVDNTGNTSATDNRIVATLANSDDQVLIKELTREFRQLRRFGGRPDVAICGSDFLDQIENELRAKGVWTQDGWATKGSFDIGIADAKLKGVTFVYDPSMDDASEPKRAYIFSTKDMKLMHMSGENDKIHNPSRPHDKYVLYKALTWTGGLITRRRNSSGVYEIT